MYRGIEKATLAKQNSNNLRLLLHTDRPAIPNWEALLVPGATFDVYYKMPLWDRLEKNIVVACEALDRGHMSQIVGGAVCRVSRVL